MKEQRGNKNSLPLSGGRNIGGISPEKHERPVIVGVIGAPHGLHGGVHIMSELEQPESLCNYAPLLLPDGRELKLVELKGGKGKQVIARFEGIGTREEAQKLTNLELAIPRSALPALHNGAYYHADLVGLQALRSSGEKLGKVVAVHNFGAGDVLEIQADKASVMVAFSKTFVPNVDLGKGTLTVAEAALAES